MKKIFGLLMVAAVVVFAAGNANATYYGWNTGDLIAVVTNNAPTNGTSGAEVATDLGSLASIQSGAITLADGNGFNAATDGLALSSGDYVYFFVLGASGTQMYNASTYTATGAGALPTPTNASWRTLTPNGNAVGALSTVLGYYQGQATASNQLAISAANSVGSSTYGNTAGDSVGGFFTAGAQLVGTLLPSNLNASGVALNLLNFQESGTGTHATGTVTAATIMDASAGNNGAALTLTTSYDSSGNIYFTDNIVPASATPIPPSVLLFVPGLLGLIGLKRRISA